jgi:hypothetical protein
MKTAKQKFSIQTLNRGRSFLMEEMNLSQGDSDVCFWKGAFNDRKPTDSDKYLSSNDLEIFEHNNSTKK